MAGYVGVPLGHILGPMVVWLIKKDEYPLVEDQGREALNFQINVLIAEKISDRPWPQTQARVAGLHLIGLSSF